MVLVETADERLVGMVPMHCESPLGMENDPCEREDPVYVNLDTVDALFRDEVKRDDAVVGSDDEGDEELALSRHTSVVSVELVLVPEYLLVFCSNHSVH